MLDNKVNGPEDAKVSEMIKRLPKEQYYIITKHFLGGIKILGRS